MPTDKYDIIGNTLKNIDFFNNQLKENKTPINDGTLCGNEHVLGLKSYSIKTWVKYIAPVLLLSQFIPFRTKLKGIKLKENAIIPD